MADRWDIKLHWHEDIGACSARKLETTVHVDMAFQYFTDN